MLKTQSVMVVDDDPTILALVSALLAPLEVRVASSGSMALDLLSKPPLPDLILLDVTMPEMDGYQVMAYLQRNPQSTIHNPQSTIHNPQSTIHNPQSTD